jgi:dTDP-glucose pyrophosphorylase
MPDTWKKSLYSTDATIGDAITSINEGGYDISLVVDAERRLLGTITDGDVRRGFLAGHDKSTPITEIMNRNPVWEKPSVDHGRLLEKMNRGLLRQMPLLDDDRRVVGLIHIRELTSPVERRANAVVLMAGGLGQRLQPLTRNTPKPLLSIGDRPILQTILESFVEQRFRKFYISVNYRAMDIKEHFGDGSKWNVEVEYLEEDRRLGTAGALTLIPETETSPLIVMNGDLLTRVNFQDLLDYHEQQDAAATMCVRQYDIQVPFGVVNIEGNRIRMIDEKPVQRFLVNAGIYVLNPDVIGLIPRGRYFDMTELFGAILDAERETAAFPVHEYWLDVGRIDDLEKAKRDFKNGMAS